MSFGLNDVLTKKLRILINYKMSLSLNVVVSIHACGLVWTKWHRHAAVHEPFLEKNPMSKVARFCESVQQSPWEAQYQTVLSFRR